MGKEKKFEILNYDELPRRNGFGAYKNKIVIGWDLIEKGFIIKTQHSEYGYNEFEFVEYIDKFKFKALYKNNEVVVGIYKLINGEISAYLVEYKPYITDKFIIHNNIKQDGYIVYWDSIENGTVLKTTHEMYGNNDITFVSYKDKVISLICKDKKYKLDITSFSNGGIGGIVGVITNEYKIEIGHVFNNGKRDLIIIDREVRRSNHYEKTFLKWYRYKCNVCGWDEGWMVESDMIAKERGCSCCYGRTAVLGINTIWDTHRWIVDDFGLDKEFSKTHTIGTDKRGRFTCKDCYKQKKLNIYNVLSNKSIGCTCGDGFSYPEKFMLNILNQIGIEFETQYSPDYLVRIENGKKSRKFSDFYLPKHKLIIEADGGIGHIHGKVYGKSDKTLEEHIEIDNWKDEQHRLHGIETIRINCFESDMEYIKNNLLASRLNDLFDLSNVDWLKCQEFALKNVVKEVCDYWNNNKTLRTASDLAKLLNMWTSTVIKYLKKGEKLGWCSYDAKNPRYKRSSKLINHSSKPVILYDKNNKIITIEPSSYELARVGFELTGVRFTSSGILESIKNNHRYKGYEIKRISRERYEEYLNSQSLKKVV